MSISREMNSNPLLRIVLYLYNRLLCNSWINEIDLYLPQRHNVERKVNFKKMHIQSYYSSK